MDKQRIASLNALSYVIK